MNILRKYFPTIVAALSIHVVAGVAAYNGEPTLLILILVMEYLYIVGGILSSNSFNPAKWYNT